MIAFLMAGDITLNQCRQLLADDGRDLTDEQVIAFRNSLETLATVIIDAWLDLDNVDQSLFSPPGDIIDQLNATLYPGGKK